MSASRIRSPFVNVLKAHVSAVVFRRDSSTGCSNVKVKRKKNRIHLRFFLIFLLFGLCLFWNVRFFDRNAISSKNHEGRLKVALGDSPRLLPRVLPVAESVPEVK